jgi:hypothetical protein
MDVCDKAYTKYLVTHFLFIFFVFWGWDDISESYSLFWLIIIKIMADLIVMIVMNENKIYVRKSEGGKFMTSITQQLTILR